MMVPFHCSSAGAHHCEILERASSPGDAGHGAFLKPSPRVAHFRAVEIPGIEEESGKRGHPLLPVFVTDDGAAVHVTPVREGEAQVVPGGPHAASPAVSQFNKQAYHTALVDDKLRSGNQFLVICMR